MGIFYTSVNELMKKLKAGFKYIYLPKLLLGESSEMKKCFETIGSLFLFAAERNANLTAVIQG